MVAILGDYHKRRYTQERNIGIKSYLTYQLASFFFIKAPSKEM